MGQITSSWGATMQKHMGLFTPDNVGDCNPLVESNPPSPPDVKPHVIWIQVTFFHSFFKRCIGLKSGYIGDL